MASLQCELLRDSQGLLCCAVLSTVIAHERLLSSASFYMILKAFAVFETVHSCVNPNVIFKVFKSDSMIWHVDSKVFLCVKLFSH